MARMMPGFHSNMAWYIDMTWKPQPEGSWRSRVTSQQVNVWEVTDERSLGYTNWQAWGRRAAGQSAVAGRWATRWMSCAPSLVTCESSGIFSPNWIHMVDGCTLCTEYSGLSFNWTVTFSRCLQVLYRYHRPSLQSFLLLSVTLRVNGDDMQPRLGGRSPLGLGLRLRGTYISFADATISGPPDSLVPISQRKNAKHQSLVWNAVERSKSAATDNNPRITPPNAAAVAITRLSSLHIDPSRWPAMTIYWSLSYLATSWGRSLRLRSRSWRTRHRR